MAYVLLFTVPDKEAGVKKNTKSANGMCVQQTLCSLQCRKVYVFPEMSVLQWKLDSETLGDSRNEFLKWGDVTRLHKTRKPV